MVQNLPVTWTAHGSLTKGPLPSNVIIDKNWVNIQISYDYENQNERSDSIILFSYLDRKGLTNHWAF